VKRGVQEERRERCALQRVQGELFPLLLSSMDASVVLAAVLS
jgi:hypothetical protein